MHGFAEQNGCVYHKECALLQINAILNST